MDVDEKPAPKRVNAPAMFSVAVGAFSLFCWGVWTPVVSLVAVGFSICAFFYPEKIGRYYALLGLILGGFPLLMLISMVYTGWCPHTSHTERWRRALWQLDGVNVAREPARRVNCAGNLKQIGLALLMYSGENGGAFPTDLAVLAEQGILNHGKVYDCPSNNYDNVPETAAELREGACGYLYFGSVLRDDSPNPTKTILAADRPENHCCGWTNVLFVDGSTTGVEAKDVYTAARENGWIIPRDVGQDRE